MEHDSRVAGISQEPLNGHTVTAIVCTLNEEASLPQVLSSIPEWVNEILVVDGHSTDHTVQVVKTLRPDARVLQQPGVGKGDALRHGFSHATSDIIVTLDADGATDPEEMGKLVEPLFNGYDFVKGSRFLHVFPRNKPWYRILGNWIITLTFDALFFRRYTDLCSGYNSFWRGILRLGNVLSADGFQNEPLMNVRVAKMGLRVLEVAHSDSGRLHGQVKESAWRQGFKAIRTIVRERFRD
ncbi:MAG: glycosyltransferase family 2 protein [Dehalococcoidia bacterium]